MNIEQVLQTQVTWMEKRLDEIEVKVDGVEVKIDTVENKVNTIETKVDGMSDTITKVYEKLAGNDLSPNGLIKDFELLKKEVNSLKEFKNKLIWAGSVILSIGALIGYLISLVLNFISVKK